MASLQTCTYYHAQAFVSSELFAIDSHKITR